MSVYLYVSSVEQPLGAAGVAAAGVAAAGVAAAGVAANVWDGPIARVTAIIKNKVYAVFFNMFIYSTDWRVTR